MIVYKTFIEFRSISVQTNVEPGALARVLRFRDFVIS
jgi:hypothetical protein